MSKCQRNPSKTQYEQTRDGVLVYSSPVLAVQISDFSSFATLENGPRDWNSVFDESLLKFSQTYKNALTTLFVWYKNTINRK